MRLRTIFELFRGFQDLSNCHLNLLSGQVIQPLEGVFNIRPSDKFLQIGFCSNMIGLLVEVRIYYSDYLLVRLWCTSFVAIASIESTSTMIFTSISAISLVGVIRV